MSDTYDLEAVYDAEIYPLMNQIIGICKTRGIPMLAAFVYANEESGPRVCATSLNRGDWQPPEMQAACNMIRQGFVAMTARVKTTEGAQ